MSIEAERVCERFFARCTGETDKPNYAARGRMYAGTLRNGATPAPALFSYGDHFPLAVWVKPSLRRRGYRARPLVVLNGDRWPGGWGVTTRHQDTVRRAVAKLNVDTILIPFSALNGAGIDVCTIEPREIRPDARWDEDRTAANLMDVPEWHRTETVPCEVTTADERAIPHYAIRRGYIGADGRIWGSGPSQDPTTGEWRHGYLTDAGETYMSNEDMHAAERAGEMTYSVIAPVRDETGLYRWTGSERRPIERAGDGLYHWTVTIHRLGDSLFSAETVSRRTVRTGTNEHGEPVTERITERRRSLFVSSFDRNEPMPLYFLAEVPRRAGARTVEQAIEALAPRAVHAAIAQGRTVYRQGDIFAVSVPLTDEQVYRRARTRARLTQWSRGARARAGELGYVPPLTANERRRFAVDVRARYRAIRAEQAERALQVCSPAKRAAHSKAARTRRYMTATDGREYRLELADSYRAVFGRNAIGALQRAETDTRYSPKWRRRHEGQDITAARRAALCIYGTSHTATEVVQARGGAVYVRGIMRHEPALAGENRTRDHIPITLGDRTQWFLCVRNTVPARDTGEPIGGPLRAGRW